MEIANRFMLVSYFIPFLLWIWGTGPLAQFPYPGGVKESYVPMG